MKRVMPKRYLHYPNDRYRMDYIDQIRIGTNTDKNRVAQLSLIA
jgi:hypothetical protein